MHSVYIITGTILIIDIGPDIGMTIECLKDDKQLKTKGHEANVSFNLICYHPPPPGNPHSRQVRPFWPGSGEWFEADLSHGQGVGQIKNTIFSLILRSTCHFSRGLHNGCGPKDHIFRGKNVLKFETNVPMMHTQMDFIFLQKKD